jgi:hypothetical protein
MDGRTKPNELYTAKDNIITSYEEDVENSDEGLMILKVGVSMEQL